MRSRPVVRSAAVLGAATLSALGLVAATPAASVPTAPSALTVDFGTGGVVLAWADNSSDETGFSIERCLGPGCTAFGQIATVGAGATTYTDGFHASGMNRYRIRAYNATGYSGYSNIDEIALFSTMEVFPSITAAPTTGHAPLTVSFDGSGSSSLNGSITGYAWSFGDNQTATGSAVTHTYAAPGVYAASLRVTGGTFSSADSAAVIITVTAPPLVAPQDLSATSPVRRQVRLTWTRPASSATSLAVERCLGSGCTRFGRIAVLASSATGYTDTTVRGGTTYSYRLAASDGTGTAYSNTAVVTVRK